MGGRKTGHLVGTSNDSGRSSCGTGLAAHIFHWQSRDLDFFLGEPTDLGVLATELEKHRPLAIETQSEDTLNGLFGRTKIQFFIRLANALSHHRFGSLGLRLPACPTCWPRSSRYSGTGPH